MHTYIHTHKPLSFLELLKQVLPINSIYRSVFPIFPPNSQGSAESRVFQTPGAVAEDPEGRCRREPGGHGSGALLGVPQQGLGLHGQDGGAVPSRWKLVKHRDWKHGGFRCGTMWYPIVIISRWHIFPQKNIPINKGTSIYGISHMWLKVCL